MLRKVIFRPIFVSHNLVMASTSSTADIVEESSPILPNRLLLSPQRNQKRHSVVLLSCGCFNPPTYMHLRMFELARDHLHRRTNYRVVEGVISTVNDAYQKKDLVSVDHRLNMVRLALENSKWLRSDEWEARQSQWCPTVKVLRHIRNMVALQKSKPPHSISVDDGTDFQQTVQPFKKPKTDGLPSAQNSTESSGLGSTISDHPTTQASQAPPVATKSASIDVAAIGSTRLTQSTDDEQPPVRVMLLCGSDLLQSFEIPNLWAPEDMEEIVRDFGIVVVARSEYDPRKVVYESDLLSKYENNIHYVNEWIANDISSTKIRRALKRSESVRYLMADRVLDYIFQHKLYGCARRTTLDILSSPSALLDTVRDPSRLDHEEPHCSYHPQYKPLDRKSMTDDSDYDNLAPCPCPLTASASAPSAVSSNLLRSPQSAFRRPSPIDYQKTIDKTLSFDSATGKPTKFPTDLDSLVRTGQPDVRTTARTPAIKSALKSPPGAPGSRQRAVSYHSDLKSATSRSQPLPSSRTLDMGDPTMVILEESSSQIPFGSVSHQRSLSNLNEIQEYSIVQRNGSRTPQPEIYGVSTAVVPKNGDGSGNGVSDSEEIAWHYNPELTKSLPNLVRVQRQTPPRHVRIMDKGVCFTPEDREETLFDKSDDTDESSLANSLVVKVKHLKLTMSPETTV